MSDNRKFEHEKRRISCEFRRAGLSHVGLVTGLSGRGLFIQSSRMPDDGAQLDALLHDDSEFGEIQLWGRAVRTKSPRRFPSNIDPGGFGVVIESASEDFFRLVALRQG